ncbi:STAS domain-containing protein [Streptacidiphilus cavernicola]|uniref:Anti-sigma factor antagonist n=1 Tax=Streptacidiphilus cavernicola TaxID=3342716 RepID=A0ABV6W2U7_9ACTN
MDHAGVGATGSDRFAVEMRTQDGIAVLTLRGELDQDTAPPLRTLLDLALDAGVSRIVVDCAGLDFCDSTGLNVLLAARLRAESGTGAIELAGLRSAVARIFAITGASAVFTVHPSVDAALAVS